MSLSSRRGKDKQTGGQTGTVSIGGRGSRQSGCVGFGRAALMTGIYRREGDGFEEEISLTG